MDEKKLLKYLAFLMLFIFLADLTAKKFYLYYSIESFDMFMHFFGGGWVGLFFIYLFLKKNPAFPSALKIMLGVLAIGILWEFFEFFTSNYIGQDSFDILDTSSDIFFDIVGGLSAIFYCSKRLRFKEKIK